MDELLKQRAALNAKLEVSLAKIEAYLALEKPTAEQDTQARVDTAEVKSIEAEIAKVDKRIELQKQTAANAERQRQLEADETKRQIEEDQRQRMAKVGTGRKTTREGPATVPAEPKDAKAAATFGYESFGHFAQDIRHACINKTVPDRFLNGFEIAKQAATTGMNEAVGPDGGFLVPTEYSEKIFARLYSEDSLISRTDMYTIARNSIAFNRIDETSRVTGSRAGGVQAYWVDEGDAPTRSKPKYGKLTLNLHKLAALGKSTDELQEDSPYAVEQFLFRHFGDEINFLVNNSLVNGTGSGMPVGILNADCLVTVTKETGQAAATLNAENILKMWSRMWARSRANAVWLINQDVEPQLYKMQIGSGVANTVVYMPPGGLSQAPYATLMGRPVVPTEFNATLGTVGDILLVDLSQWVTAVKGGGPKNAVSMHLHFDTDEMAYRTTYRLDSQPWWNAALTPFKGSNTLSPAVALGTRA